MQIQLTLARSGRTVFKMSHLVNKGDKETTGSTESTNIFKVGARGERDYGFGRSIDAGRGNPVFGSQGRLPRMPSTDRPRFSRGFRSYSSSSEAPPRNFSHEKLIFQRSESAIDFSAYDSIPVQVEGPEIPPMESFKDIDFGSVINLNIQLCGYDKPTPIQKYSLPYLMKNNDLIACAQTGSGKTVAFLLPIIQSIKDRVQKRTSKHNEPVSLILAPTRELVQQIVSEAKKLIYRTNIRVVGIYGGAPHGNQLRQISSGCHIMVATPGRLIDFISSGAFELTDCKHLIIDEADRMLDMGFFPQIKQILNISKIPVGDERQTIMFSATFPKEVKELASKFLMNEVKITVGSVGFNCEQIKQHIVYISQAEKEERLINILNEIISENDKAQILVFADRKRIVDDIEIQLYKKQFKVVSIHGDRTQMERNEALNLFRSKKAQIMVATDVASRGIDIPSVSHVINYAFPNQIEDYVHRIGRTGRCGNTGVAITFFTDEDGSNAKALIKLLKENKQSVPEFLYNMRPAVSSNRRQLYRGYSESSSDFYHQSRRYRDDCFDD